MYRQRLLRIGAIFLISILTSCSTDTLPPVEEDFLRIYPVQRSWQISYDAGAHMTLRESHAPGSGVVINGSYFGQTSTGMYYPAGLWISDHRLIQPIQYGDPNLSHIVGMDDHGHVEILPNMFGSGGVGRFRTAFQAGPLVLSGGILQDLDGSWHAHEPHERTLMGVTQSGRVYFYISEKKVTLDEVARYIRVRPEYAHDPLTLINLDGGPSTASAQDGRGYHDEKRLPILIQIDPN